MTTHLQDYVELLNAEQHVQVDKLRENAKHGVAARVRGEVWMYLLHVLSPDRTTEISSLLSLTANYQAIPTDIPPRLTELLHRTALAHHTQRFHSPTYAGLITSLTAETPQPHSQSHSQSTYLPPSTTTASAPGSVNGNGNGVHSRESTWSLVGHSSSQSQSQSQSQPQARSGQSSSSATHNPLAQQTSRSARSSPHLPPQSSQIPPPFSLPDDPHAYSQAQAQAQAQASQPQTLRSQYGRFLPPPPSTPPSRHGFITLLEEVLGKFYNAEKALGRDDEYRLRASGGLRDTEAGWVWLATPFACCFVRPVAVFLAFQKMMERIRSFPPFPSQLATLLTLIRQAQPELFSFFEDEQVSYYHIASSWLRTLLAKEMWLGDVLRLWDAYLAADDMFSLHCYVCVAILGTCKETLEELDGSEAKLMLLDLPPMDVDRLLQDASNLRVSYPLAGPVEG